MTGSDPDGARRRWRLRTWSPDYERGSRPAADLLRAPQVDAGPECPAAAWAPVGPPSTADRGQVPGGPPGRSGSATADLPPVAFVDGVQRVDAWADLEAGDDTLDEALFASYLAGAVVVGGGSARFVPALPVSRAVFGAGPGAPIAGYGRVEAAGRPEDALQAARDALEIAVAISLALAPEFSPGAAPPDPSAVRYLPGGPTAGQPTRRYHAAWAEPENGLLVLDGPLHERGQVPGALGLIKSHRVDYLDHPDLRRVRGALAAGQRTPVFSVDSGWVRWSWYVRVAGSEPGWAGLVRCEASAEVELARAVELADLSARVLPCFASSPVKDPRAPQNLVPIGSLERWLRHRLGDRDVLERRLRRALAARG